MPYDQSSLFLAAGISGAALAVTLLMSWFSARTEGFLLTWAAGMMLLVLGVTGYALYSDRGDETLAVMSFTLLTVGFAVVYGAAYQFRTARTPVMHASISGFISFLLAVGPFLFGYNGLATLMLNFSLATMLLLTVREYWIARAEAPVSITGMSILYALTALSFLACGVVILNDTPLVMAGPPDNWAEDINAVMCLIGITGIGALSLALNQTRAARRHRTDALTDSLTGLLNRRALFDAFGAGSVETNTAIIVFDLDRFKSINDQFGHATGDEVLRRFADALRENMRPRDRAARLGGEEFALVMPRCTPDLAVLVAERIRALFESELIQTEKGDLRCTVSAGVAFTESSTESFDTVLLRADTALYLAKGGGRNRVMSPGLRLVA